MLEHLEESFIGRCLPSKDKEQNDIRIKDTKYSLILLNIKDGKTDQVDSDDQWFRWCCLHQLWKTPNIHRLRNNVRKNNSALNGGGDLDYICK